MPPISFPEIIMEIIVVLFVVALLTFGGRHLRELGRGLREEIQREIHNFPHNPYSRPVPDWFIMLWLILCLACAILAVVIPKLWP